MIKKVFFFVTLLSVCVFANDKVNQDLKIIEQDLEKTGVDIWVLATDIGVTLINNIPSLSTMTVDGTVDGILRQYKPIAKAIKNLESTNMVNGAVVRDFSKTLTVVCKQSLKLPVDLSGRLYDDADLYSQVVKLLSKIAGFSTLYAVGALNNNVFLFVVNNGGDILSQGVLDAGKEWRKNQTLSFNDYLLESYSLKNAVVSIPAKGAVAYGMGWMIDKLNVADAAQIMVLLISRRVSLSNDEHSNRASWEAKQPFAVAFMMSFASSVAKSLLLTTACKTAVDLTKPLTDGYLAPAVKKMFNVVLGNDEL